jgi:glycosyltransferase involved in cell wall biosynthesis
MKETLFISTMTGYAWGGSEELWAGVALRMARKGRKVRAAIAHRKDKHPRIKALESAGCKITQFRFPLLRIGIRKVTGFSIEQRILAFQRPGFVVISQGMNSDGLPWMEACMKLHIPYSIITQSASSSIWFPDTLASRLRAAYTSATRVYFVSQYNKLITEDQIGSVLPNAEVIWNPVNVPYDVQVGWPKEPFRLAIVGRLAPESKGTDVVLRALAQTRWGTTPPRVTFYGEGPSQNVITNLRDRLELKNVEFAGHCRNVCHIWRQNHLLLLPSRFEGLPLSVVEAMLCGRPCLVTWGSGGDEIIQNNMTGFICPAPTVPLVQGALERAWQRRQDWEQMGKDAARSIKALLPEDPCNVLVVKIEELQRKAGV